MTNPLGSNTKHSHTFSTRDLTQGQIPGANPRRLLALPEDILDEITRRISSGGTPQENAANAIAWGRVAALPHITTQASHVECVLDKAKHLKHLDEALVVLWQHGIALQLQGRVPEMTTAREIRGWMADPANTGLLNTITEIFLRHPEPGQECSINILRQNIRRLRIIPPEVNRLKVIPPEINAIANLHEFVLEYSLITQIGPRAFAGCPQLHSLNLRYNQISQVDHEAFTGCQALQWLTLNNNQISRIHPRTFADCRALQVLVLGTNQIAEIAPQTFANRRLLRDLSLENNLITQIAPETFAGCVALEYLQLQDNRIIQVDPQTFAGCGALQLLNLNRNPITQVDPRTFASYPALRTLHLSNDALLYALDTQNSKNQLSILNAFSRYVCRSPLAAFYKALSEGRISMSDAAELLKGLEDRNLIYEMVYWEARAAAEKEGRAFDTGGDDQWGENHVCDNEEIFRRALKRAVREKFKLLSAEQKCAVHDAIYRIAQEDAVLPLDSPEWNDPNWGEHHREDNVLMFIDAMGTI